MGRLPVTVIRNGLLGFLLCDACSVSSDAEFELSGRESKSTRSMLCCLSISSSLASHTPLSNQSLCRTSTAQGHSRGNCFKKSSSCEQWVKENDGASWRNVGPSRPLSCNTDKQSSHCFSSSLHRVSLSSCEILRGNLKLNRNVSADASRHFSNVLFGGTA